MQPSVCLLKPKILHRCGTAPDARDAWRNNEILTERFLNIGLSRRTFLLRSRLELIPLNPQDSRPASRSDIRIEPRIIRVFDQPGEPPGFLCAGQRDPPSTLWQIFRKCGCQSGVRCGQARYNRNARAVDPGLLRIGF